MLLIVTLTKIRNDAYELFGSPDPSHFIFECNIGRKWFRQMTTLNLNLETILSRS